jgi:hypothetical protein
MNAKKLHECQKIANNAGRLKTCKHFNNALKLANIAYMPQSLRKWYKCQKMYRFVAKFIAFFRKADTSGKTNYFRRKSDIKL